MSSESCTVIVFELITEESHMAIIPNSLLDEADYKMFAVAANKYLNAGNLTE